MRIPPGIQQEEISTKNERPSYNPLLRGLGVRRSTPRIALAANIERKEETDARRRLRGIVDRGRRIHRLRIVIGLLVLRPVLTPAPIAAPFTIVPAVVPVPLATMVVGERRCDGHTAHRRGNGECRDDSADCRREIPGLRCRGFHLLFHSRGAWSESLPTGQKFAFLRVVLAFTCSSLPSCRHGGTGHRLPSSERRTCRHRESRRPA